MPVSFPQQLDLARHERRIRRALTDARLTELAALSCAAPPAPSPELRLALLPIISGGTSYQHGVYVGRCGK